MPGRTYTSQSRYRYGFNGKENDSEVKGEGNQQDYGMRIYDPRIGRFLSVDPIGAEFPNYSPYHYAGNTPIWAIDMDGLEPLPYQEWEFGGWRSIEQFNLIQGSTSHVKVVNFGDYYKTGHNIIAIRDQKDKAKWWYATYDDQVGSLGNAQKGNYRLYNPETERYEPWTPEGWQADDEHIKSIAKDVGVFGKWVEKTVVSAVIIGTTGGAGKAGFALRLLMNTVMEVGVNGEEADAADIILSSLPGMGGVAGIGVQGVVDWSPLSNTAEEQKVSSPLLPNTSFTANKPLQNTAIDIVTGSVYKGVEMLPKKTIKGLTVNQTGFIEVSTDIQEKAVNKVISNGAEKQSGKP